MDADEFRDAWGDAKVQEVVERTQRIMRRAVVPAVLGLVALAFLLSCFFSVQPDEVGVVTRFGAFQREVQNGLHFKWPWGLEAVTRVKTQRVHKEEFGFETLEPGVRTQYRGANFLHESLMLTGDLNIAEVQWIVQYRIARPREYLFGIRNPQNSIRDASEAVMRKVVGDHSVTEVLTSGRAAVNAEVEAQLQVVLDAYGCGVEVVTVKLQDVTPPEEVKGAFNEVNQAKQEKEQTINQALQAYNSAIPAAAGQADETIARAEGFSIDRVNRAQGDANRYLAILAEYEKAPDVTRSRLYLETMTEVLPKVRHKILAGGAQGAGLVPLLHLGDAAAGAGGVR